jgi:hypothetical protein
MVAEVRANYDTEYAAIKAVAAKLGVDARDAHHDPPTILRKAAFGNGRRAHRRRQRAAP